MPTSTTPEQAGPTAARHTTRIRAFGVAGAVLASVAAWTVAVPLIGVDLRAVANPGDSAQTVALGPVAITALAVSLLGWALLALLEKRASRARTVWTAIAVGVLVLSLAGPLVGGVTASAKLTLALMHGAVGAVLIPVLRRSSPTR